MLRLTIPVVAVILVLSLGFALDPDLRSRLLPANPRPTTFAVAGEKTICAPGRIEGLTEEAEIGLESTGRVTEILVREGEFVPAGAVLLKLDEAVLRHEEGLAAAELAIAEAERDRLRNGAREEERQEAVANRNVLAAQMKGLLRRLERTIRLRSTNASTAQQLDDLLAEKAALEHQSEAAQARCDLVSAPARDDELQRAAAKIDAARCRLELARAQRDKMTLRAPFAANVLKVQVQLGELAGPHADKPVVILADVARWRVRAFIDEFDAPQLRLGMPAIVTADGLPDVKLRGVVVELAPRMGRKELWTDDPTERFADKVREALIDLEPCDGLVVGLRVDVTLNLAAPVK